MIKPLGTLFTLYSPWFLATVLSFHRNSTRLVFKSNCSFRLSCGTSIYHWAEKYTRFIVCWRLPQAAPSVTAYSSRHKETLLYLGQSNTLHGGLTIPHRSAEVVIRGLVWCYLTGSYTVSFCSTVTKQSRIGRARPTRTLKWLGRKDERLLCSNSISFYSCCFLCVDLRITFAHGLLSTFWFPSIVLWTSGVKIRSKVKRRAEVLLVDLQLCHLCWLCCFIILWMNETILI